jgi:hypothetical protein
LALNVELQERLLAQERELDSREGAIATWEDGLAAFKCSLGKVCTKCDAKRVWDEAIQQDFLARTHASSVRYKQLNNLRRTLEERQTFLCLQEMDLEVQEVILAKEQTCILHHFDGRDLSVELEEIHVHVDGIGGERAAEAGQLSHLVVEISNALVDLGMLPVQDIPQLLKLA